MMPVCSLRGANPGSAAFKITVPPVCAQHQMLLPQRPPSRRLIAASATLNQRWWNSEALDAFRNRGGWRRPRRPRYGGALSLAGWPSAASDGQGCFVGGGWRRPRRPTDKGVLSAPVTGRVACRSRRCVCRYLRFGRRHSLLTRLGLSVAWQQRGRNRRRLISVVWQARLRGFR